MEPEQLMKEGFELLFKATKCFESAINAYKERNDENKGDKFNIINVSSANDHLHEAYNLLSEIWENDIQK